MSEIDIDVRAEPYHEAVSPMVECRPMLTWGYRPDRRCHGWTLWYLEDPADPNSGVDTYLMLGDLADVDRAVQESRHWLHLVQDWRLPAEGTAMGRDADSGVS